MALYIAPPQSLDEKLDHLRALLSTGAFHHATMRIDGPSLWNGLYVFRNDEEFGFRGFSPAVTFAYGDEADAAYALVRGTGVSMGAYGNG